MKRKILFITASAFGIAAAGAVCQVSLKQDLTFDDLRADASELRCQPFLARLCTGPNDGVLYYNAELQEIVP